MSYEAEIWPVERGLGLHKYGMSLFIELKHVTLCIINYLRWFEIEKSESSYTSKMLPFRHGRELRNAARRHFHELANYSSENKDWMAFGTSVSIFWFPRINPIETSFCRCKLRPDISSLGRFLIGLLPSRHILSRRSQLTTPQPSHTEVSEERCLLPSDTSRTRLLFPNERATSLLA